VGKSLNAYKRKHIFFALSICISVQTACSLADDPGKDSQVSRTPFQQFEFGFKQAKIGAGLGEGQEYAFLKEGSPFRNPPSSEPPDLAALCGDEPDLAILGEIVGQSPLKIDFQDLDPDLMELVTNFFGKNQTAEENAELLKLEPKANEFWGCVPPGSQQVLGSLRFDDNWFAIDHQSTFLRGNGTSRRFDIKLNRLANRSEVIANYVPDGVRDQQELIALLKLPDYGMTYHYAGPGVIGETATYSASRERSGEINLGFEGDTLALLTRRMTGRGIMMVRESHGRETDRELVQSIRREDQIDDINPFAEDTALEPEPFPEEVVETHSTLDQNPVVGVATDLMVHPETNEPLFDSVVANPRPQLDDRQDRLPGVQEPEAEQLADVSEEVIESYGTEHQNSDTEITTDLKVHTETNEPHPNRVVANPSPQPDDYQDKTETAETDWGSSYGVTENGYWQVTMGDSINPRADELENYEENFSYGIEDVNTKCEGEEFDAYAYVPFLGKLAVDPNDFPEAMNILKTQRANGEINIFTYKFFERMEGRYNKWKDKDEAKANKIIEGLSELTPLVFAFCFGREAFYGALCSHTSQECKLESKPYWIQYADNSSISFPNVEKVQDLDRFELTATIFKTFLKDRLSWGLRVLMLVDSGIGKASPYNHLVKVKSSSFTVRRDQGTPAGENVMMYPLEVDMFLDTSYPGEPALDAVKPKGKHTPLTDLPQNVVKRFGESHSDAAVIYIRVGSDSRYMASN